MAKPFAIAAQAVETWLAAAGAQFVTRVKGLPGSAKPMEWEFSVRHPQLRFCTAKISLPRDFPSTPAQIYLHKDHCLVLPHVEETGKVCLGVEPSPGDYDNPVQAVGRVLRAFDHFLEQCRDEAWIASELRRESFSYWIRYCDREASRRTARPTASRTYMSIQDIRSIEEGALAAYSCGNKIDTIVCCREGVDPHTLAKRHAISVGQLIRGQVLFIPLSQQQDWRPQTWPQDFDSLDILVGELSDHTVSVKSWIQKFADRPAQPYCVAFVQGPFIYAYQIFPPLIPGLSPLGIEPIPAARLDAEWSLTRGYKSEVFTRRQAMHVLVLGCGSLGSPVIELLARAGIGHITIVDHDLFFPENCSRHVLGLSSAFQNKALQLADRLSQEIPGVSVKGVPALASSWISDLAKPGMFNLVVDCTGESSVRILLGQYRHSAFQGTPIVHAWMEPFCAAAHVVLVGCEDVWPKTDPAESLVNAAHWPKPTQHEIPACGAGFHPYGVADTWQAAGFTAERLLSALDRDCTDSAIWSWIRSKAYFESLEAAPQIREIVPLLGDEHSSSMLVRSYHEVLTPHA